MSIKYGSVCSGIEAATVAWNSLGWKPAWFAEIENFPSAVLQHHYPDIYNLGDMTLIPNEVLSGNVEAPDLLVGGTPCQAFSVAGLRNSLEDDRGQLSITYIKLLDSIDFIRGIRADNPAIAVWENVPGVLSTKDNAFGCFLAGLAGEDEALVPSGGKWTNAGYVLGPKRAVAWRILDAQYFGVAQRRRRVFVIASARTDICPAKILFESEGMRRDTPPSREKGKATPCLSSSVTGVSRVGFNSEHEWFVESPRPGGEAELKPMWRGGDQANSELCEDMTGTLNCNKGQQGGILIKPTAFKVRGGCEGGGKGYLGSDEIAFTISTMQNQHIAYSLQGSGHTSQNRQGSGWNEEVSFTLNRLDTHGVEAISFEPGVSKRDGANSRFSEEVCSTLSSQMGDNQPAVAFNKRPMEIGVTGDVVGTLRATDYKDGQCALMLNEMQVRRLTPVECARLQGFPDHYLDITYRNKPAADGPKYKALGNSMAVPVMKWIGERIQMVEDLCKLQ